MPGPRLESEFTGARFQPDAYPHWLDHTDQTPACRGVDLRIFFPEHGNASTLVDTARAICGTCPLLTTCRDWALEQPVTDLHGIWGGTSQTERRRIHRRHR